MRGKKAKEVRKRMGRAVEGFYSMVEAKELFEGVTQLNTELRAEVASLRAELAAMKAKTEDAEDAAWIGSIKTK